MRSIGGFVWDHRGGVDRPSCPAPLRPLWSSHKSVLLPLQGLQPAIRALPPPPPPSPRPPSGPVGPSPVVLDIVELALSLAMGTAMPRHLWGQTPPIPANPPDFFNFLNSHISSDSPSCIQRPRFIGVWPRSWTSSCTTPGPGGAPPLFIFLCIGGDGLHFFGHLPCIHNGTNCFLCGRSQSKGFSSFFCKFLH